MTTEAKIIKTGKIIYCSGINDLKNESHAWFSHPDGTSPNCSMVMDNKQFVKMLKDGEVEAVPKPGTQLTI